MSVNKYTVTDVMENRMLRALACEYLRQYNGDFPFLRDAKRIHEAGEYLRPGVVKGVLNCMLSDPKVRDMPTPVVKYFHPGATTPEDVDSDFAPEPVYPRRRSRQRLASSIIPVKFQVKFPFVTSENIKAQNIHFLFKDHEANWYRAGDEIQPHVRMWCGAHFPVAAVLLGLYDALDLLVSGERKVCGACERQANQSLMTLLTDYESSLIREENPLPESLTRSDIRES